jgi:exosortase/archaeosortase family protein
MLPAFFKKFDTTTKLIALLPLPMVAIVTFDQWFQWSTKEDYTFGYLVPFFSGYVIYERWPDIEKFFAPDESRAAEKPAAGFWEFCFSAGAFFSLLCFVIGGFMRAVGGPNIIGTFLNTFGFCGVAAACVWMISEKDSSGRTRGGLARWNLLELFTFPVLVWVISGPFLYLVDSQVKNILLEKVTAIVVVLLNAFDYTVTRTGNVILLPGGDNVGVADACSGIRSLTACVFCGAFLSAIFINGRNRKLIMLALAATFAIFLNILRTAFLTLWAYNHGSHSLDFDFGGHAPKSAEFTMGTVHDLAGYAAMGVTFLILAALVPVINLRLNFKAPDAPPPPSPEELR